MFKTTETYMTSALSDTTSERTAHNTPGNPQVVTMETHVTMTTPSNPGSFPHSA